MCGPTRNIAPVLRERKRRVEVQNRPPRSDVMRYLAALFQDGSSASAGFVEVRFREQSRMLRAFYPTSQLASVAAKIVRLASQTDVYVGALPLTGSGHYGPAPLGAGTSARRCRHSASQMCGANGAGCSGRPKRPSDASSNADTDNRQGRVLAGARVRTLCKK